MEACCVIINEIVYCSWLNRKKKNVEKIFPWCHCKGRETGVKG